MLVTLAAKKLDPGSAVCLQKLFFHATTLLPERGKTTSGIKPASCIKQCVSTLQANVNMIGWGDFFVKGFFA